MVLTWQQPNGGFDLWVGFRQVDRVLSSPTSPSIAPSHSNPALPPTDAGDCRSSKAPPLAPCFSFLPSLSSPSVPLSSLVSLSQVQVTPPPQTHRRTIFRPPPESGYGRNQIRWGRHPRIWSSLTSPGRLHCCSAATSTSMAGPCYRIHTPGRPPLVNGRPRPLQPP